MTDLLAQLVLWLNSVSNAVGSWLLAPLAVLPGWLSATLVAVGSGVLLLAVFKYTSSQRAIKRVRDDISANLLTLKLFKESVPTALRAQGRIVLGAGRLLVLTLVPMLVMTVPVTLVLGQLSLWYQARPLRVGEEAVVTLKLNGVSTDPLPEVRLLPSGAQITIGPVRVLSQREICWGIQARDVGYHRLVFQLDEQTLEKELAVGNGFMRVSLLRPSWSWSEELLHSAEEPLRPDCAVHSIRIDYPRRSSWTSGSESWMVYWFVVSMVAAFCFRRVLNVHI